MERYVSVRTERTGLPAGPQARGNELLTHQGIDFYRMPADMRPPAGRQHALLRQQGRRFQL